MSTFRCHLKDDRGFSLIEMLVALTIFSIVTIGITPLILSSLRASVLTRSYAVAKNMVHQSMERVRGLPVFESMKNQVPAQRRDVLDLYFPDMATGYAAGAFTTTCTSSSAAPAASGPAACPPTNADGTSRIPTGYTVTFTAQFVQPATGTNPQTFDTVTPSGYNWNSVATEVPPTRLLRMVIKAQWTEGTRVRNYELASYIGDRVLTPDQLRATATISHVIDASTSFRDLVGGVSNLRAQVGNIVTNIETKSFSAADVEVRAAQMSLTREAAGTSPAETVEQMVGAESLLRAPPNVFPVGSTSGDDQTLEHPDLVPPVDISFFGDSTANGTGSNGAQVVNELPKSAGAFSFGGGNSTDVFWANNQADTGQAATLQLDPTTPVLATHHISGKRLGGNATSEATATSPTSGRKSEGIAHAEFGKMIMLPTTFIAGDKGVVVVSSFTADIQCKATANAATSVATGSWSATLQYFKDALPSDNLPAGSYQTISLSGSQSSAGPDPLAALKSTNPLVYDAPLGLTDVYLFKDTAAGKAGYFDDMSSQPIVQASKTAAEASVTMSNVLSFDTTPTDPVNESSSMVVNIGKASCKAVDLRA